MTIDAVSAPLPHVGQGRSHSVTQIKERQTAMPSAQWAVIVAMGGAKNVQKGVLSAQAPEIVQSAISIMR